MAARRGLLVTRVNPDRPELKAPGPAPAVKQKIAVERQDFPGVQFIGKMDKAGVGEIDRLIAHAFSPVELEEKIIRVPPCKSVVAFS
jgi:hypothetical protein